MKSKLEFRKETPNTSASGADQLVVALAYDKNSTPWVSRRGSRVSGDEILRDARRYGIPIVIDGELSKALYLLESNSEIPYELYPSVADYLIELKMV